MTEEELNEKLAKWAGFTYDPPDEKARRVGLIPCGMWIAPDGNFDSELPDFTHSLDDCFEWLVPKLTFVQVQVVDGGALCLASAEKGDRIEVFSATDQPAYALCKAIEKVLEV